MKKRKKLKKEKKKNPGTIFLISTFIYQKYNPTHRKEDGEVQKWIDQIGIISFAVFGHETRALYLSANGW